MVPPAWLAAALMVLIHPAASSPAPLRIDGLVAAVFSPFDPHGALNLSVISEQHAYLAATGVDWVFTSGTTGESLSLTTSERKALAEAWIAAGANVIAHVGTEAIVEAQELAAHAEAAGAKAIGVMPPTFFKPATVDALAATIAAVCAAASSLPCYYYHIPSMTGAVFAMYDLVRTIEPLSANFAGVKYTGMYEKQALMDVARVLNYAGGKYEVLSGREEIMLEAASIGIKGHVGSQFNFAGDLYAEIHRLFGKEGLTPKTQHVLRALQMQAVDLILAWEVTPSPAQNGVKYFQNLAGVPVGDARLPRMPVDVAAKKSLQNSLQRFCTKFQRMLKELADADAVGDVEKGGASLLRLGSLKMCSKVEHDRPAME